jgi:ribonuclease-3
MDTENILMDLADLQDGIHYHFRQVKLLLHALTHSSYANEQQVDSNERLEFLGDAVLELSISQELFRRFPEAAEGELTRMRARLVNEPALAGLARQLDLGQYILLGKGEACQGGADRNSVLSDTMEAIFGAVYLEAGFEQARQVILHVYRNSWPATDRVVRPKDNKSRLQEITQREDKSRPTYRLERSTGPEHAKEYVVSVTLPSGEVLEAQSTSVKKAEQMAAAEALAYLEARTPGQ